MRTKLVLALVVVLIGIAVFMLVVGRDPLPPPPGVDAFGDPLPDWAVARIGRFVTAPVRAPFVFSADGKTITAAIGDGEVGTVDVTTSRVLARTRVHARSPGTVHVEDGRFLGGLMREATPSSREARRIRAISPDGTRVLLTGSNTVEVVRIETGEVIRAFPTYETTVAVFAPDGDAVVVGGGLPPTGNALGRGGEVRQVDIGTGAVDWRLRHPYPFGIACLAGRDRVAVNGCSLVFAETSPARTILATPALRLARRAVAASPAGDRFARFEQADAGAELFLVVHDAGDGREHWRKPLGRRTSEIAFSPDGGIIAVGGTSIRLLDAADGTLLREFANDAFQKRGLSFSPDGTQLATVGHGRLFTFDAATGKPVREPWPPFDPPGVGAASAAWSADSTRIVTGGFGGVHVFDAATGRPEGTVLAPGTTVTGVRFSNDGLRVLVADADGGLSLHDLDGGRVEDCGRTAARAKIAFRAGHPVCLSAVADRGLLFTDGDDTTVLQKLAVDARGMVFSPAGDFIAAVGDKRVVRVWDTASLEPRDPAKPFTANHVTFSTCGRYLAAHDGGPIRVHDATTGAIRFEIMAYSGSSHIPLALSPGAKLIAWAGLTPVIELWSVGRGKLRTRLVGHSGTIQDLAFSPDGTRLLSRSRDGTLLVWDVTAWD